LRYPGLAQNRIGLIASFGEKLKNACNWTQPFLCVAALIEGLWAVLHYLLTAWAARSGALFWALCLFTVLLMLFPAQHVMAAVGVVIFSEHWRVPQRTNAVANFIDRVGDDMELLYQTAVIGANDGVDWRIAAPVTSTASMQPPPSATDSDDTMASFLQTVNTASAAAAAAASGGGGAVNGGSGGGGGAAGGGGSGGGGSRPGSPRPSPSLLRRAIGNRMVQQSSSALRFLFRRRPRPVKAAADGK
jgi:uncharacterized membrane protein YgcG